LGTPPDESAWEVGIVDPLNTEEMITTAKIKEQGLSTSGNYENFVEFDGKRIGHLLNPVSGKTSHSILSGTTIAHSAIEADALSTGFYVLGIEGSKKIVRNLKECQSISIVQLGNNIDVVRL
ncbi:MAG: FAD:protein FMN transferase, partial [Ignavibacteriae bacterium]|nr:FAD:protein FMN transferase [Ignavibacteriota bacterium]